MISTPYNFESNLSEQDFQKIGQFALRWALIEHTIGNCLRVVLGLEPEQATIMIFPLSLDHRMRRIWELSDLHLLSDYQLSLLQELRPLILAMQYLRNTTLHGIVMNFGGEDSYFHLRSKKRQISKEQLFSCEALINYAAHVTQAFRFSLGDKLFNGEVDLGHTYALPNRPSVPDFLPKDCRAFPKEDRVIRGDPPGSSPR